MKRKWIEHDGKGYPLPRGSLVEVRKANGKEEVVRLRCLADANGILPEGKRSPWFWGIVTVYDPYGSRIIAYRRHDTPESETERRSKRMTELRNSLGFAATNRAEEM